MKPDLELMNDENSNVRWEVAKKINIEHLPKMMNDNHSYVRLKVAERIASEGGAFAREHLPKMMNDESWDVRQEIARRIADVGGAFANEHLPKMMNDEDWEVRWEVAKRIDPKFLGEMFGFDFSPEYQKGLIKILAKREDLKNFLKNE